jgi:hypothetical protein
VKLAAAPLTFACLFSVLCAAPVAAQQVVGYPPSQSPYRDLETPQRITVYAGYFLAGKDPIGAHPHSAPMIGARYEVTVGGPAQFFVRLAFANSKRNAYDPSEIQANRSLGTVNAPLLFGDLGFSFNLTGQKSWHHLVPTAGFALGAVNASTRTTNDPYYFGTSFEVSTDFGIRYVPNNDLEARFNLGNTLYQTRYPTAYYTQATDGTSLLQAGTSRSSYRNNWMFTAGVSFPIFR